jgi:hypothetical protein
VRYAFIPAGRHVVVSGPWLPGGTVVDEETTAFCRGQGVEPGEICLTHTSSGGLDGPGKGKQVVEVRRLDGSVVRVDLVDVLFVFPTSTPPD